MKIFSAVIKVLFFLLLLGAFLLPGKYSFWPEFHQSASAAAIAIILCVPLFLKKKINFNFFALFLLIICFFISIDFFIGRETFFAFNFYGILYVLAALIVGLYFLNEKKDDFIDVFSLAMIFISIISFLLQIYQITGWGEDYQLVVNQFQNTDNRSYANIGQPNLLGTIYVVSIVLSLLFFAQKKISSYNLFFLIFIYSVGIYLTASRVAMLSLFFLVLFFLFQEKFKINTISATAPVALLIIFSAKIIIPYLFFLPDRELISSNISNGRFEIWSISIELIKKNWIFGYGFNRVGLANFTAVDDFHTLTGTFVTQSHNIFLDFLIWFGVPVGIILSIFLIFVFAKIFFDNFSFKDRGFIYLSSFPIFIHSLFEYPLYYQNFLVVISIIIGLSKNSKVSEINPYFVKLFTIIFVFFSFQCFYEMKTLEVDLLDQKLYANRIYGAENKKPKNIIYADLIEEHIALMAFRDDKEINENVIKRMEEFSRYYLVPRNIYLIVNFYKDKKDEETFEFWRKRAEIFLPPIYKNYYKNLKLQPE